jgi:hypothetical protein
MTSYVRLARGLTKPPRRAAVARASASGGVFKVCRGVQLLLLLLPPLLPVVLDTPPGLRAATEGVTSAAATTRAAVTKETAVKPFRMVLGIPIHRPINQKKALELVQKWRWTGERINQKSARNHNPITTETNRRLCHASRPRPPAQHPPACPPVTTSPLSLSNMDRAWVVFVVACAALCDGVLVAGALDRVSAGDTPVAPARGPSPHWQAASASDEFEMVGVQVVASLGPTMSPLHTPCHSCILLGLNELQWRRGWGLGSSCATGCQWLVPLRVEL